MEMPTDHLPKCQVQLSGLSQDLRFRQCQGHDLSCSNIAGREGVELPGPGPFVKNTHQVGMVGTTDRSKLWLLSREPALDVQSLQKLREHAKKFGHWMSNLSCANLPHVPSLGAA